MTWEQRMADRAAARRTLEEPTESDWVDPRPPLPADRWVLRPCQPDWCPTIDDDPERGPDPTSCRRCFTHNEAAEQLQRARHDHFIWDLVVWDAVQACNGEWDIHVPRNNIDDDVYRFTYVGCDCWCHMALGPPILLA